MRRQQAGFLEGPALYLVAALGTALLLSWAGAGLALWWQDGKLTAAQERATRAEALRAAEEQSRKGFQAAAGACSEGVGRLAALGAARDRLWGAQLARSAAQAEAAQAEAATLLQGQRRAGESECEAMKRGLDEEIDRRHKR